MKDPLFFVATVLLLLSAIVSFYETPKIRYFNKEAEQGVSSAQLDLGAMYAKGEGVPRNYIKAYVCCAFAAAQGDESAKEIMGLFRGNMTQEQIAKALAMANDIWAESTGVAYPSN